jgi:hypothetical protein
MEVRFAVSPPKPRYTAKQILDAAQQAEIHTFGWPLGIVLLDNESRPRPTKDGVQAEVSVEGQSYDFWKMRENGDYYLLSSLFEDQRAPGSLFMNTRIVRVTEALLFCGRLYGQLGLNPTSGIHLAVRHVGLAGRTLAATGRRQIVMPRKSSEDESEVEVEFRLGELESRLTELVKAICGPMFMLFDFMEVADPIYEEIVDRFVAGEVT